MITISSVGDISFSRWGQRPELLHKWISPEVKDFLNADVRIANMEYVLLPDGEKWPGGLCLAEVAESLEALNYAGINVVTLGNNHILDFKREVGMLTSMQALREAGIKYCGAGINVNEARRPAIIEIKGVKIAVFSRLHDYSFIDAKPLVAGENRPGVALLDIGEISESIESYRKQGDCDIAVLCVHWGMQNVHDHHQCVHELGKECLSSGADLVLGSHSHVIQGLMKYNNKFCFFGQGNFYFYPYPYHDRVLYGPEATRHRIAAASRFVWDGHEWNSEVMLTHQNSNETIVRLSDPLHDKLLYKVNNSWNKYRPLLFQIFWRLEYLRTFKQKSMRWYMNPLHWPKIIGHLLKPPSLG